MKKKISIIYYSHFQSPFHEEFERMLTENSGLLSSEIEIIRFKKEINLSLSDLYSHGLLISNADLVLFVDEQAAMITQNWANELINHFKNEPYGILGLAGKIEVSALNLDYCPTEDGDHVQKKIIGCINYFDEKNELTYFGTPNRFDYLLPAVVVHGSFMAINKARIKADFDSDFTGFSNIDTAFCLRNHLNNVLIGVVSELSIKMILQRYHCSADHNKSVFEVKYLLNYKIPIIIHIPDVAMPNISAEKKIHIIIPTKDELNLLTTCIASIIKHTRTSNYVIWIADTGSTSENLSLLKEMVKKLVKKERIECVGPSAIHVLTFDYYNFSKINNSVVRKIESLSHALSNDYLLFCNNDVRLLNDCVTGCLSELLRLEERGKKIGTIGIRLHYPDNTIQHAGLVINKHKDLIHISHKSLNEAYNYITASEPCLGNTGAFLFIRLNLFKELGMFNEYYLDVCQDVQLNLECLVRGYTNYYLGNLVAYHHESISRSKDPQKMSKQKKDWDDLLFPFILKNLSKLIPYFVDTA